MNVHFDARDTDYRDVTGTIRKAKQLGFHHLRAQIFTDPYNVAAMHEACAAGLKWDLIIMADPAPLWPTIRDLAANGCIHSLEGPNEINVTPPRYHGLTGKPAAIAIQQAIYTMAKRDPLTASIPIYSFTVAPGGDTSGLAAAGQWADYGASHPYVSGGAQPGCCVMTMARDALSFAPGKPLVVTETGYRTRSSVDPAMFDMLDEQTQARLLLNTVFRLYSSGVDDIIIYQLLDSITDTPALSFGQRAEAHFGLFAPDRIKASGQAFARLTQSLRGATRGSTLAYSLTGTRQETQSMALKRPGGGTAIVIWSEVPIWNQKGRAAIEVPPLPATLTLPAAAKAATVTNLITGAKTSFTDVSTMTVPIAADPLVIDLPGL